jgi:Fe-Mn family superoxide dismutase
MTSLRTLTALALLAAALAASPGRAAEAQPAAEPFTLPALPWPSDVLEPAIDRQTMEIHHARHHGAQVAALNAQAKAIPELASMSLEAILAKVSGYPAAVRNNAGGHWNHTMFWQNLAPLARGGAPSAALTARIDQDFGSLDKLRQALTQAAATRFGSGWAWVIVRADGSLAVTSTPNQDNPLMDVVAERGTPIIGVDVWEHAYYLRYQNRRGDYLTNWWTVLNWHDVNRRFEQAITAAN